MELEVTEIKVHIEGISDIMFNRFIDHSQNARPPEQSLYLAEGDAIVLPSENIWAFLFSENPPGCAKSFEGKKGKEYIRVGQAHLAIPLPIIPIMKKGVPMVFKSFNEDIYVSHYAPRTKQGTLSIKQEVLPRPVIHLPWELEFPLKLIKNDLIDETKLLNWFSRGGIEIAIGNYRPRYGRFTAKFKK